MTGERIVQLVSGLQVQSVRTVCTTIGEWAPSAASADSVYYHR
jgi:hypothetical protein